MKMQFWVKDVRRNPPKLLWIRHCRKLMPVCSNTYCLFVLRFYGPVNPMGLCRTRSVYLTTLSLGKLSPLSGEPVLCTFFCQKLTTALLESTEGREWPQKFFSWSDLHERMLPTRSGSNPQPPEHKSVSQRGRSEYLLRSNTVRSDFSRPAWEGFGPYNTYYGPKPLQADLEESDLSLRWVHMQPCRKCIPTHLLQSGNRFRHEFNSEVCLFSLPFLALSHSSLRKHAYSNILKISSQKNEIFQIKKSDIFHVSAQNIDLCLDEAVLTSTHKLCFDQK